MLLNAKNKNQCMKNSLLLAAVALSVVAYNNEKKIGSSAEETTKYTTMNSSNIADTTKNKDIVITRIFDAPVETVWKAWTEPEQVMRWWGPKFYTSPYCNIDFRVGGNYVFGMRAPKEHGGGDMYVAGIYKKIIPMEFMEFGQGLSDKEGNKIDPTTIGMPADFPEEIRTTLVFKAIGDKTELIITEYDWKPGQMRDYSEIGLSQSLDKLAGILN